MISGKGSLEKPLTERELYDLCAEALSDPRFDGLRVIVVMPDYTSARDRLT